MSKPAISSPLSESLNFFFLYFRPSFLDVTDTSVILFILFASSDNLFLASRFEFKGQYQTITIRPTKLYETRQLPVSVPPLTHLLFFLIFLRWWGCNFIIATYFILLLMFPFWKINMIQSKLLIYDSPITTQKLLFFYKFKKSVHEWKAHCFDHYIGLFQEKKKKGGGGGCGHRTSRGIEGRACANSRGRSKKFLILVFDLGISKGFWIILHNFQGWNFVFPGIFRVNIPYHKPIVCSYF